MSGLNITGKFQLTMKNNKRKHYYYISLIEKQITLCYNHVCKPQKTKKIEQLF